MVARRGRDHAAGFLLIAQLHQFVVGATDLEGERRLQIFALEQDLIAEQRRECRCRLQGGAYRQVVDRRGEDLLHVLLKQQGATHGCLLAFYGALETEKQNPPLGRVWVQPNAIPPNEEWR